MISKLFISIILSLTPILRAELPEMVIGEESILPGINLVFEAAIKDDVFPPNQFGLENESDIHIEVLANWNVNAPQGSPLNGFVAYLQIEAEILNQAKSATKTIVLLPHVNLTDSLHYALNTSLPGRRDDLYTVIFTVTPPHESSIGLHYDWREEVGSFLPKTYRFVYKDLDFYEIANSSRR